jgi:murein L,D-transpeptidase YafK
MRFGQVFLFVAAMLLLASCGTKPESKFKTYRGPAVTAIIVDKSDRQMFLLNNSKVLEKFNMHLGFAPTGHKQFEGDGKTPEGQYRITHRNPNSQYHLSLGISYPNAQDRAFAEAAGKPPGGDIFIHGESRRPVDKYDWTAGCIAVTDEEMELIYAMVKPGTPIFIRP